MAKRRFESLGFLGLGLGLAFVLFGLTFRGPRKRFWDRMTGAGIALGGLSLATQPELRQTRITLRDILLGITSAGVLYGIFHIGDRITRRILPQGGSQIESIYGLKRLRPRRELMLRLGLITAPAEELFWRGFVQNHFTRRVGRWWGTVLSTAAYGGAHIASGNFTLIGAATVAGAFWSAMAGLGFPMGTLIVSHVVWDNLIFLIAPTAPLQEEVSA